MSALQIITNNHWHNFLYGYELPESVRNDFDYLDDSDYESRSFIKYKGRYYDSGEFMSTSAFDAASPFIDWHGYISDSYFSGILVRNSDDHEQYQVARYVS